MPRLENLLGVLGLAIVDRLASSAREDLGLSLTDAAALKTVAADPGCSVGRVAETLGLTHAGAVRTVDRLSALHQVRRTPGADGRTVALRLTAEGEHLCRQLLSARAAVLGDLLNSLSAADRKELERLLDVLLPTMTPDLVAGERLCRLCDESVCPQSRCPVTLANT